MPSSTMSQNNQGINGIYINTVLLMYLADEIVEEGI